MSTQNKDYDLVMVGIEDINESVSRVAIVFDDIDPDTAIVYRCHGGGIFLTILADTMIPPEEGLAWYGTVVGRSEKAIFYTWENTPDDCKVKAKATKKIEIEIEDTPDSELTELFKLLLTTYKL